uniref:ATP synthase F0 subunit 8 n=1 Tax=Hirudo nipponia TaxID=42736 RepID=X2C9K3_HIRNI|nr:ATP synthase F0 subunit 8 [Hirudo nipponia]AGL10930.1 ATP synthase F0 subunit 8 [Hirudo nipponia]
MPQLSPSIDVCLNLLWWLLFQMVSIMWWLNYMVYYKFNYSNLMNNLNKWYNVSM